MATSLTRRKLDKVDLKLLTTKPRKGYKKDQVKIFLRQRELAINGNKAELVNRLFDYETGLSNIDTVSISHQVPPLPSSSYIRTTVIPPSSIPKPKGFAPPSIPRPPVSPPRLSKGRIPKQPVLPPRKGTSSPPPVSRIPTSPVIQPLTPPINLLPTRSTKFRVPTAATELSVILETGEQVILPGIPIDNPRAKRQSEQWISARNKVNQRLRELIDRQIEAGALVLDIKARLDPYLRYRGRILNIKSRKTMHNLQRLLREAEKEKNQIKLDIETLRDRITELNKYEWTNEFNEDLNLDIRLANLSSPTK